MQLRESRKVSEFRNFNLSQNPSKLRFHPQINHPNSSNNSEDNKQQLKTSKTHSIAKKHKFLKDTQEQNLRSFKVKLTS